MDRADAPARRGPAEVFGVFLRLGLTSFGGPVAHLGYFRDELVTRRRWLSDHDYGDLVALCQFLPGPASSQVGFGLGLLRAGPLGALAAFIAFTLPSATLLVAVALTAAVVAGPVADGVLTGLAVVAVAVVAQAVRGMAGSLAPDRVRAAVAVLAAVVVLVWPGTLGQVVAIVAGALAGLLLCRDADTEDAPTLRIPVPRRVGALCLVLFLVLLVGLPVASAVAPGGTVALLDAFYRSGALVFGGGHVVLPLLEAEVVGAGWLGEGQFLAGYAAAQAVPGPLFTFAAYLGTLSSAGPGGVPGALLALLAVFLPGFLLLVGVLPFWDRLRRRPLARAGVRGANAAVVGILAAALYDPVFTSAVTGPVSLALALVCFVLLVAWRTPPWVVVLVGAAGGLVLTLLGWWS